MAIQPYTKGRQLDLEDPAGARERRTFGIAVMKDSPVDVASATPVSPQSGSPEPAPRSSMFSKMAAAANRSIETQATQSGASDLIDRSPLKPAIYDQTPPEFRDRHPSVQQAKILTQRAMRALALLSQSTEKMSIEQVAAEATLGGERAVEYAAKVSQGIEGLDARERADFAASFAATIDCLSAAKAHVDPVSIAAAIGRANAKLPIAAAPGEMAGMARAVFIAHVTIGAEASRGASEGPQKSGRYLSSFYHAPSVLTDKAVSEIVDLVEGMVGEADLPFADAREKIDYAAALVESCVDLYIRVHREYIDGVSKRIGGVKKEIVDNIKANGLNLEPMFVQFRNSATIAARVALDKVKRMNWRLGVDASSTRQPPKGP